MKSKLFTRRDFSVHIASLLPVVGMAGPAFSFRGNDHTSGYAGGEEVTHTSEAIHQEVVFKASRKRVYEALTDAKQFNRVVELSTAMKSGAIPSGAPAEISSDVGGAFSIFGGHIVGKHLELVPNERIVQAWRVVDWDPGVYSIVRFQLAEQGSGTKLIFDHTSFPEGKGQHLAEGWKINYWEPLEKYLAH